MRAAVLALQGAFAEQEHMLEKLGIEYMEIRKKEDALADYDALILPGGESTVMGKLLKELNIFPILKQKIESGLPVLATCAGLILLAENLAGGEPPHFGTLPVSVKRNGYGRQLGSFRKKAFYQGIGTIPMVFIRAPYIEAAAPEVEILAEIDNRIAAVRYKNQTAMSFHPELADCRQIYSDFFNAVQGTGLRP